MATFTKQEAASLAGKRVKTVTAWRSSVKGETGTVVSVRQQGGGLREWEVLIEWDNMTEVVDGALVRRHLGVATKDAYNRHAQLAKL